jgi:microcystin-dependent protein
MAQRPYITPPDVPTARISRCLSFPDSLEWEALINGFLAMGTRIENWQQLEGGIDPENAVAACVELLNDFFEAGACIDMTPIATIVMFASETIPAGWLLCDGQAISREDYTDLFAAIGIEYGAGDETTTFNLPDFTDRSPMGTGGDFTGLLGVEAGEHEHTLAVSQIPAHNHAVNDPGHTHPPLSPSTSFIGNKPSGTNTAAASTFWGASATTGSATTGITIANTGDGLPHPNVHPVLGVHFIIFTGAV